MKRRAFLTSLGALASTAIVPSVPSIPLLAAIDIETVPFKGGRFVFYADTDGIFTCDVSSAYPFMAYDKAWKLKERS